jgi:hypothetical protein
MSSLRRRSTVRTESGQELAYRFSDSDLANDPLRNINLEAMGGAGKVLKMLAEKVGCSSGGRNVLIIKSKAATPTPQPAKSSKAKDEPPEEKTGVVASFEKAKRHSEFWF